MTSQKDIPPGPRTEADILLFECVVNVEDLQPCYKEIQNLRWIESEPIYKTALEEWERRETSLMVSIRQKKTQIVDFRNEIYSLVGFFLVFQGVLLTAVAQSNLLQCENWWSPVMLSAFLSVAIIFGVVQKFPLIGALEKAIHSEEHCQKGLVARSLALRREGSNFRFSNFLVNKERQYSNTRTHVYLVLVVGPLFSFGVLFIISNLKILCHSLM